MNANARDCSVLEHMISYCDEIEKAVQRFGNSYEAFQQDTLYRHACAMCILQIGELSAHLSEGFRQTHREIPWVEIKAMRNVAAHAYGKISVKTTWKTIENDIPALRRFCVDAIKELSIAESET